MDRKKFIAMTARMDQEAAKCRSIGKKITISQMEACALVTLAKVGCLSIFSELEGQSGVDAGEELTKLLDGIRDTWSRDGQRDGLHRLVSAATAIVESDRLGIYVTPYGEAAA